MVKSLEKLKRVIYGATKNEICVGIIFKTEVNENSKFIYHKIFKYFVSLSASVLLRCLIGLHACQVTSHCVIM